MKIALAQIDLSVGEVEENISKLCSYIRRASKKSCDIVIFPEMSDTGYSLKAIPDSAVEWSGGYYQRLCQAALDNQINVICGLSEKIEGSSVIYNTAAVISPEGKLVGKYRKCHLYAYPPIQESSIFTAGNESFVCEINGTQVGLSICYDLRFPELYRLLTDKGARIIVNISAWPAVRGAHWEILSRARAVENQLFYIGVNRVGEDAGCCFYGNSLVISPAGETLIQGGKEKGELLVADIDLRAVDNLRRTFPVLKSRRSDL